jgi:dihydropteroate synthase
MPQDAPASKSLFKLGNQIIDVPFAPPWVMGIVNVTPDSFSDGGDYLDPARAVQRALEQIEQGARIIDIGAESTRPGSVSVPAVEQIHRAVPMIEALRAQNLSIPISIDTCLAEVAQAAIQAGANMVNDTSALGDDESMAKVVAESGASIILVHRKGRPHDMQQGGGPVYDDIVVEISEFLSERIEFAVRNGIDRARIAIDPGIGFGKRAADNLIILDHLEKFAQLGCPVTVGASRKRFIGELLNIPEPRDRMIGSVACAIFAALNGASIIRAHDVLQTVQALQMIEGIVAGGAAKSSRQPPLPKP